MTDFIYNYIEPLFIIFMFFAIIGWLVEVMGKLITKHKFINRGFLIGPYCPIYGWGAVLITILLSDYKDNIFVLFVMSMAICSIIEYLTSYFMEKLYKVRWWDYSQRKFNINGRVCLEFAIVFGIGGVAIVKFIDPFILNMISNFSQSTINITCIILFAIIFLDNIISGIIIGSFGNLAKTTTKDATEVISTKVKTVVDTYTEGAFKDIRSKADLIVDKIEEYRISRSEELKKIFLKKSILHRRLIQAFPNIEIHNRNNKQIKEEVINRK